MGGAKVEDKMEDDDEDDEEVEEQPEPERENGSGGGNGGRGDMFLDTVSLLAAEQYLFLDRWTKRCRPLNVVYYKQSLYACVLYPRHILQTSNLNPPYTFLSPLNSSSDRPPKP